MAIYVTLLLMIFLSFGSAEILIWYLSNLMSSFFFSACSWAPHKCAWLSGLEFFTANYISLFAWFVALSKMRQKSFKPNKRNSEVSKVEP